MKHTSFEKEILKRGYDFPINLEQRSCGQNGWAFALSKGDHVMEWLSTISGTVHCLRLRHKEGSITFSPKTIKQAFRMFEKCEA